MPTPQTLEHHVTAPVTITYPACRFDVRHGYKDHESVQVRLEADGSVYCCYVNAAGRLVSVAVPFDRFRDAFHVMLDSLEAQKGEVK